MKYDLNIGTISPQTAEKSAKPLKILIQFPLE
jgi:hypothetical protein